ncbi:unnamed protein product [Staurois parvus]|uniref:Uncharacterized protein n=1 Tax=Staurois parvus TaxID=386267 RepID=A0ABN9CZ04_9NEOB|nr:unnamed protein product [Staurois parvus]
MIDGTDLASLLGTDWRHWLAQPLGTGRWHCRVAQVGGTAEWHRWGHCWAQVGALLGTVWAGLVGALLGTDHQGTDHQCPDDRCRSPL